LWRDVDLDLGVLHVTSTLIRVTGECLVRKPTKSQAGERVLQLPEWCVILLDKRRAVGVSADEPILGTVDGTFRDPRTVTRWLVAARKRHGFEEWMTFHAWRKTTATVLDEAGATARMIADQLGHSRGVDDAGRVLGPTEPGVSRGGCTGGRRSDGLRRKRGGSCGARDGRDDVRRRLPWSESWRGDSNP
jgi:Phage integrase family